MDCSSNGALGRRERGEIPDWDLTTSPRSLYKQRPRSLNPARARCCESSAVDCRRTDQPREKKNVIPSVEGLWRHVDFFLAW